MATNENVWGELEIFSAVLLSSAVVPVLVGGLFSSSAEDGKITELLGRSTNPILRLAVGVDYDSLLTAMYQVVAFGQMEVEGAPEHFRRFARSFYWSALLFFDPRSAYEPEFVEENYYDDAGDDYYYEDEYNNETIRQLTEDTSPMINASGLVEYCGMLNISVDFFFGYVLGAQLFLLLVLMVVNSIRLVVKHCRYLQPKGVPLPSNRPMVVVDVDKVKKLSFTGHFFASNIRLTVRYVNSLWYPILLGPIGQVAFHVFGVVNKPSMTPIAIFAIVSSVAFIYISYKPAKVSALNTDLHSEETFKFRLLFQPLVHQYKKSKYFFWLVRVAQLSFKAILVGLFIFLHPTQQVLFLVIDLGFLGLLFWQLPYNVPMANVVACLISSLQVCTDAVMVVFATGNEESSTSNMSVGLGTFVIVMYVLTFCLTIILMFTRRATEIVGVKWGWSWCTIQDEPLNGTQGEKSSKSTFNTVAHDAILELQEQ